MADNTVQATLRSNYEDGIARGIEQTQATIERSFAAIEGGIGSFSQAFASAFGGAQDTLSTWRTNLSKTADESENHFHRISLASVAFGIGIAEVFLYAGRAVFGFLGNTVKEASRAFEVKTAFEALTSAAGVQADVFAGKLKAATEGQISGTNLLTNANKVLQSGIPITTDAYTKLVENVFRLAKSTGTDAAQAQDVLTNSLIRGNARGFQAIGIHINVKDAVTGMAEAQGEAANALNDHAKLQAFYNDLMEKTEAAVGQLGEKHMTLEDILLQSENVFKSWIGTLGVAILRSGVFQELMEAASQAMLGMSISGEKQNSISLAVNATLISLLQTFATVARWIGVLTIAWDTLRGATSLVWNTFASVVGAAMTILSGLFAGLFGLLGFLPGGVGRAFKQTADQIAQFTLKIATETRDAYSAAAHAFDGFGSKNEALQKMADSTIKLAEDAEKLRNSVVKGEAGFNALGEAAQKAGVDLQQLQQQMKIATELLDKLRERADNPEFTAMVKLKADLAEIESLTLVSAEKKNRLRLLAEEKYRDELRAIFAREDARIVADYETTMKKLTEAEMKRLEQDPSALKQIEVQVWLDGELRRLEQEDAKKREEERRKQTSQAIASATEIMNAVKMAEKGMISQDAGMTALGNLPKVVDTLKQKLRELQSQKIISDEQMNEITKLKAKLDEVAAMKFSAFDQAMKTLQNDAKQFSQQAGAAFTSFFSAVATGQKNAAAALLSSFGSMIGKMIANMGQTLFSAGITEMLMAATVVGRAAGANEASGALAMAEGLALMAVGGAVSGLSSAASSSSSAAKSSSTSSTATAATPTQVLTLPNGAVGSQQGNSDQTINIKMAPVPGFTSQQANREFRLNPNLRLRIQNG